MRQKLSKSPSRKELLDYRDSLLAEAGFEDIEDRDGNLKTPTGTSGAWSAVMQGLPLEQLAAEAKGEYYRQAAQAAHGRRLKAGYREIWQMHVEGLMEREIAAKLRTTVMNRIRAMRKKLLK